MRKKTTSHLAQIKNGHLAIGKITMAPVVRMKDSGGYFRYIRLTCIIELPLLAMVVCAIIYSPWWMCLFIIGIASACSVALYLAKDHFVHDAVIGQKNNPFGNDIMIRHIYYNSGDLECELLSWAISNPEFYPDEVKRNLGGLREFSNCNFPVDKLLLNLKDFTCDKSSIFLLALNEFHSHEYKVTCDRILAWAYYYECNGVASLALTGDVQKAINNGLLHSLDKDALTRSIPIDGEAPDS